MSVAVAVSSGSACGSGRGQPKALLCSQDSRGRTVSSRRTRGRRYNRAELSIPSSLPTSELKHQTFRDAQIFAELSEDERSALMSLAEERRYHAGQALFYDGDPCDGLHMIAEGTVKIVKTSPTGREIMLAMETAPSSVAEVPLFDGGSYPATVIAHTDVITFLVPRSAFRKFCSANGEVAYKLMAVVGARLRTLVGIVESLTFGSLRQRLASALLEYGKPVPGRESTLPITQEELALRLGTVREVVSRNLKRFQLEGLIRVSRREIAILDVEGLTAEAETEY